MVVFSTVFSSGYFCTSLFLHHLPLAGCGVLLQPFRPEILCSPLFFISFLLAWLGLARVPGRRLLLCCRERAAGQKTGQARPAEERRGEERPSRKKSQTPEHNIGKKERAAIKLGKRKRIWHQFLRKTTNSERFIYI